MIISRVNFKTDRDFVLACKLRAAMRLAYEDGDSHLGDVLSQSLARLVGLELAIVKISSALDTNPFTGAFTAQAIITTLSQEQTQ